MRHGGLLYALLLGLWVMGCVTPANSQSTLPYPECLYDHNDDGVVNFPGDGMDAVKVSLGVIPAHEGGCGTRPPTPTPTPTPVALRDPYKQPFTSTSIWNMPIGAGAQRTAAHLHTPTWGTFVDPNYWINRPASPSVTVRYSSDAWKKGLTNGRCIPDGGTALTAPIPANLIIPGSNGEDTPNNAAAIVSTDGRTILQTQPLTHCTSTGPWTTFDVAAPVDIYGDGIPGAHGGSGLSSIGGTVRVGELVRGGRIPHAMQWILSDGDFNCAGGCYRWPATRSDCGQSTSCYPNTGTVGVKPGALLALPTTYDCDALRTEPGRIVCHAMQDYGGYIVDAGWDPAYFTTEVGPDGDVQAQFQQEFGFALSAQTVGPWAQDIHDLTTSLDLITNNGPGTIGGGGSPRVPLAPPLQ